MIYAIPYILIVALYGVVALLYTSAPNETSKRYMELFCIGTFVLFIGFRGFIGDDWTNYYPFFQRCGFDSLTMNVFQLGDDFTYEPGFTIFVLICKNVFGSYYVFNLLCCVINVYLLYIFLRRYVSNIPLGFMLYMCMGGFIMSINLLRNTMAILIIANSLHFITERRAWPYFGACFLALMLHVSSLIYFPLYFFFHRKLNRWVYLAIFVAGIGFFLSGAKLVSPIVSMLAGVFSERMQRLMDSYTGLLEASRGISIGFLERVLTGGLIFCYYNKLCEQHKDNVMFINAFLAYFIFYFFFCEFDVMSSRLATLFTFAYWTLWASLVGVFAIENNRRLFIAFLAVYSVLKMAGTCRLQTYSYDNILFGSKSYYERLYIHDRCQKDDP